MTNRRGRLGLLLAPIRRDHPQALRRRPPFHHETTSVSRPNRRVVPCTGSEPDWERAAQVVYPHVARDNERHPAAVGGQSRELRCDHILGDARAFFTAGARDPHWPACPGGRGRHDIDQRPFGRDAEIRRGLRDGQDAVKHRHGTAVHILSGQIEPHGPQGVADGVHRGVPSRRTSRRYLRK